MGKRFGWAVDLRPFELRMLGDVITRQGPFFRQLAARWLRAKRRRPISGWRVASPEPKWQGVGRPDKGGQGVARQDKAGRLRSAASRPGDTRASQQHLPSLRNARHRTGAQTPTGARRDANRSRRREGDIRLVERPKRLREGNADRVPSGNRERSADVARRRFQP